MKNLTIPETQKRKAMTPKEKAEELYEKMYDKVEDFDLLHDYPLFDGRKVCAKQCALIAVEEILEIAYDVEVGHNSKPYWNEVKTEIEKL